MKKLCVLGLMLCAGCAGRSTTSSTPGEGGGGTGGSSVSGGGSAGDSARCSAPLSFADPKIEAEVRSRVAVPSGPITPEKVASVTGIVADGASSLAGLECLPKLGSVVARGGGITDLSPLDDHASLWAIDVSSNPIQSPSGLTLGPPPNCHAELNLQGCSVAASELDALCAIRATNATPPYDGWHVTWTTADGSVKSCNQACLAP